MKLRFILLLLFIPLIAGTAVGGYLGIVKGTPSLTDLKRQNITGTRIYADDNSLIAEISPQKGVYVPLGQIPQNLRDAVVAVEDTRFYKHGGVDYFAIGRALLTDLYHRELKEGASTITQQLAKITFLSPEKTFKRKIREMALAYKIEKNLTKDQILELYLNRVYFGHGAYGVEMAAKTYFGKPVSDLTLPEAALIAGLIQSPEGYSPFYHARKCKERQLVVLDRMRVGGYINREQMEKAGNAPLKLSSRRSPSEAYQYFLDYVKRYLEKRYGEERVYKGDLRVYTTLVKDLQVEGQKDLRQGLRDLDKRRGWRGPLRHLTDLKDVKTAGVALTVQPAPHDVTQAVVLNVAPSKATLDVGGRTGTLLKQDALWAQKVIGANGKVQFIKKFNLQKILRRGDVVEVRIKSTGPKGFALSLEQEPTSEGALVSIDPKTGFIRAMVGGYDYRQSEFNRAVSARRQCGSAFKPIIYADAMESGMSPTTVIDDEPITFEWGPEGKWSPQNYDDEFWGPTTLRKALAYSRNVVTVKLLDQLGIDRVISFAQNMGITEPMPRNLTLALGSLSITPLELVTAYAPFANGGIKVTPSAIKYITDSRGRILESNEPPGVPVISPDTAFLITSMLEDVINYGTGHEAKSLGGLVAGKTGTTNDYKDAWFVGYSPSLVAGVWVGFDDMKPLGHGEVGGVAATPVWTRFMRYALSKYPSGGFGAPPEDIVSYTVDAKTGQIIQVPVVNAPGTYQEYFKKGSEPQPGQPLPPMQQENKENANID